MLKNLFIDKEFKELIPPLTEEEFQQLEENILKEGCRDALVIWDNKTETLIDGHNRYEICTKHNIQFNTVQRKFTSRNEVIEWIITNQFGRRNINPYVRSVLALRLEDVLKARAKLNQVKSGGAVPQISVEPLDTQKELAKIAGVSHDTISKVKAIQKDATPEQKQKLMKGETKINTVFNEIKKKKGNKPIHLFKTCTICSRTGPEKEFLQTHNRCLECHSQISDGSITAKELREYKEEQRKIPLGDEESFNAILPEITEVLNEFMIKINPFTYTRDLYLGRTNKQLVELVKRCRDDIEKIIKIMEV